jgi:hypothetical protein
MDEKTGAILGEVWSKLTSLEMVEGCRLANRDGKIVTVDSLGFISEKDGANGYRGLAPLEPSVKYIREGRIILYNRERDQIKPTLDYFISLCPEEELIALRVILKRNFAYNTRLNGIQNLLTQLGFPQKIQEEHPRHGLICNTEPFFNDYRYNYYLDDSSTTYPVQLRFRASKIEW